MNNGKNGKKKSESDAAFTLPLFIIFKVSFFIIMNQSVSIQHLCNSHSVSSSTTLSPSSNYNNELSTFQKIPTLACINAEFYSSLNIITPGLYPLSFVINRNDTPVSGALPGGNSFSSNT